MGYASVLCQGIGLVITAYGLALTWRAFKAPGESFVEPAVRAVRRLNPFRSHDRVVHVGAADAVAMAMDASVRVTFGPLPEDDREAIAQLGERLQSLRSNLEATTNGIRGEIKDIGSRLDALDASVSDSVARLEDTDRRVATDGIRWETLGLGIVALGLILQVFA